MGGRKKPSGAPRRLPKAFVLAVWGITFAVAVVTWFVLPALDSDCPSPCDGYAYAGLGVLWLGLAVLIVAKLAWLLRSRVAGRRSP